MNTPHSFSRQKLLSGIAVLVIIIAAGAIAYHLRPQTTNRNHALFVGLGQAVARETAQAIHERGPIVVILPEDYQTAGSPRHDDWQALKASLKKYPAIQVVAIETVSAGSFIGFERPRSEWDNVLIKHPAISALVSLCGIPTWDPRNPFQLPPNGPKIIVVENEPAAPIQSYFANGSLAVAILPRLVPDTNPVPPTTPAAWFARQYQIYTTENYADRLKQLGAQ